MNQPSCDLTVWCTIKEYKRIKPWASEFRLRALQNRASKNMLPDHCQKMLHPDTKRHTHLVHLTEPIDIIALRHYRKVKEFQKAKRSESDPQVPTNPPVVIDMTTKSLNIPRLKFSVPVDTPIDIVMRSPVYRDIFLSQLEEIASKSSINKKISPATFKNRYSISLNNNTHEYLKIQAKDMGVSLSVAFMQLFMDFLQTNQNVLRHAADEVMRYADRSSESSTHSAHSYRTGANGAF
jgi:hypothetical protein